MQGQPCSGPSVSHKSRKRQQQAPLGLPTTSSKHRIIHHHSVPLAASRHPSIFSSTGNLYTMHADAETGNVPEEPTVPAASILPSHPSTGLMAIDPASIQLSQLAQETHAEQWRQQDLDTEDKGTRAAYGRHLRDYEAWWDQDQAERVRSGKQEHALFSHPITVTKVALFLKYETAREKTGPDGKPIPGSRLGPSSIKQCISALEYERSRLENRPDYVACPESQKPLRKDVRIKTFERRAEATEPERIIQMQFNKANGLVSDTYTEDELFSAANHLLKTIPEGKSSTPIKIAQSIRNRAMLLLSTSMAFRGDNTRNVLLSDIYLRDIRLPAVSLTHKIKALVVFSNQGKENTTGRPDEQGSLRHRVPEVCCIGAIAFHFFAMFHIEKRDVPDFAPDYTQSGAGELGLREWYNLFLFEGRKSGAKMSYSNHRKSVNKVKNDLGIHTKKSTHGGRHFAVDAASTFGTSVEGRKALGGWNDQSGSFRPCYDHALPLDGLLGAAGFNANDQLTFFVARDVLDPPDELLHAVFPWAENEECALEKRIQEHGRKGRDNALKLLLEALKFFRRVVIQDAAVLYAKYPDAPLFTFPPFNSHAFREFSWLSSTAITRAEEDARLRLQSHPSHVAVTFQGLLTTNAILQEESRIANKQNREMLEAQMQLMYQMAKSTALRGVVGKKRKAAEAALDDIAPLLRDLPTHYSPPSALRPSSSAQTPNLPVSAGIGGASTDSVAACANGTVTEAPNPDDTFTPASGPASDAVPATTLFTSPSGSIYPSHVFPLSDEEACRTKQIEDILKLEKVFAFEKLLKHKFVWLPQDRTQKACAWTPFIEALWTADPATTTVRDYWAENRFGKDGRLSIQEMDAQWGARWRRNVQKIKTDYRRRMKVVELIVRLSNKANWNSDLALRFLHDTYPHETRSGRSLADFITDERVEAILAASSTYIH